MKIIILLIAPLLLTIGLNADVIKGSTLGQYSKPGAPIDIIYQTQKVNTNENSDVNITLITNISSGTMHVDIMTDKDLNVISNSIKEISFNLSPEQKKYALNLTVSSASNGLYYVRLLTKIDKGRGSKIRAFAVPIRIGPVPLKKNYLMMKLNNTENISVSKAIETIRPSTESK